MSAFFVIAICLLSGILLRRFAVLPENASSVLNQYVIWVALPALVLTHIPSLEWSQQIWFPMLAAWMMVLLSAIIVILLVRFFNWSRSTRCVLLLLVPLGNTSFVGIPMLNALLGESAIPYALLYDQLGSFLALATYGAAVIAAHSGKEVTSAQVIMKVVSFPPFIALTLAALANFLNLDLSSASVAFEEIGATLVPVVMVAVGFQWQFKMAREDAAPLVVGLTVKLLVAPLLLYLLLYNFELPVVLKQSLILESAMAPMISAGALAILANQRPQLVASMIGYGLLVGFMTVPLWYWLIT